VRQPVAVFLGGSALLIVLVLRGVLNPSADRLPGVDSHNLYTWEVYTRSSLGAGVLPFWNPYHFAGTPHLADPQTTVFYPPALALKWLPVPAFLGWMMALHLWIAGAGTLFAARTIGAGWMTAAAAAIAVTLGGSVAGWIHNGHLLLLYSVAWVPWALGLAVVSVRSGRVVPDGRLVAVLLLNFLSGYLQGSLYLAAAVALYFLFSAAWPDRLATPARRWAPLAQLMLLAVLCVSAAAFQLLPTAVLVAQAGRSSGLSYGDALEGGWQLKDVATLLFPFFGSTETAPYRSLSDRLAYVGWILTVFAPFAFFSRERLRIATFLGLLAALACAVALGDAGGLFRLQQVFFPGLRVPGRALFLATVSLALLGAAGLEAFIASARRRRWQDVAVPAGISGAAVALAALTVLKETTSTVPAPGWPWLPAALAGAVVAIVAASLVASPRVALSIALLAVIVDVTALSAGAVATVPITSAADIRRAIGPPIGGRTVSTCENRIGTRELFLNGEPALDGPAALYLRDYAEWAYLAKTGDIPRGDGVYRRIGSERELPARADLLNLANVTRIVSCPARGDAAGESSFAIRRSESAWPRAVWVCGVDEVSRRQAIARLLEGRYAATGTLLPLHSIRVRWAPRVGDAERAVLEERHHLQNGVVDQGVTWRYVLGDPSVRAVLALLHDPDVEDTAGVDRSTGMITPSDEVQRAVPVLPGTDEQDQQLLIGTTACATPVDVSVEAADRPDGFVAVRVKAPQPGHLFLSEPIYSERRAYIDGIRVPALKADLAFTAVAVPAGEHRIELRYTPSSFYAGSLISGATGIGYAGLALIRRRRKLQ
jgi:hypothetical protein